MEVSFCDQHGRMVIEGSNLCPNCFKDIGCRIYEKEDGTYIDIFDLPKYFEVCGQLPSLVAKEVEWSFSIISRMLIKARSFAFENQNEISEQFGDEGSRLAIEMLLKLSNELGNFVLKEVEGRIKDGK